MKLKPIILILLLLSLSIFISSDNKNNNHNKALLSLYSFIDEFNNNVNNINNYSDEVYKNFVIRYGKGRIYKKIIDKKESKYSNKYLLKGIFDNKECSVYIPQYLINGEWYIDRSMIEILTKSVKSVDYAEKYLNSSNLYDKDYNYRIVSKKVNIELEDNDFRNLKFENEFELSIGKNIKAISFYANEFIIIDKLLLNGKECNFKSNTINSYKIININLKENLLKNNDTKSNNLKNNDLENNNLNNNNLKNNIKVKIYYHPDRNKFLFDETLSIPFKKRYKKILYNNNYFDLTLNNFFIFNFFRLRIFYEKENFTDKKNFIVKAKIPLRYELILPPVSNKIKKDGFKYYTFKNNNLNLTSNFDFFLGTYKHIKLKYNNIKFKIYYPEELGNIKGKEFLENIKNLINDTSSKLSRIENLIGKSLNSIADEIIILFDPPDFYYYYPTNHNFISYIPYFNINFDKNMKEYIKTKNSLIWEILHTYFDIYYTFKFIRCNGIFSEGIPRFLSWEGYAYKRYNLDEYKDYLNKNYNNYSIKIKDLIEDHSNIKKSPIYSYSDFVALHIQMLKKGSIFFPLLLYKYGVKNFQKVLNYCEQYLNTGLTYDILIDGYKKVAGIDISDFIYDFIYTYKCPVEKYVNPEELDKYIVKLILYLNYGQGDILN